MGVTKYTVTKITCDWCSNEIEEENALTVDVRGYDSESAFIEYKKKEVQIDGLMFCDFKCFLSYVKKNLQPTEGFI